MIVSGQKMIYLDHAAATPMDPDVLEAMRPYQTDVFANPSSLHQMAVAAREAIDRARASIAKHINAHADEVVFTSGGTESDNLAIYGVLGYGTRNTEHGTLNVQHGSDVSVPIPHVVTSAIEHHAVLETLTYLQHIGSIDLTIISVDRDGLVDPVSIKQALRPETILVSVMMANNEIGTVEPIAEIGRMLLVWRKEQKTAYPYFHTDACQAVGTLEIDVEPLHVDLLSASAAKIYGPKGVGMLFVRRGTKIRPMVRGGGQEQNRRSGTENVPGIVGFAKAWECAERVREGESARLTALRDRLVQGLLRLPKTRLNGHAEKRLPNNVNVTFLDAEGEAAVLYLDAEGIMASTGSACASSSLEPSHVILAIGLPKEAAHGSVRFTLGRSTTQADIDRVLEVMPLLIDRLRRMSPVRIDEKWIA